MYPAKGVHLKDFETKWFVIVMTCSFIWAFNGGWVNGVSLTGVWYAGLTHLTGTTTISAIRFINPAKPGQYTQWDLISFLLAWTVGALFGAAVLGSPRLRWGRLQGFLTLIHGVALLLAWHFAPVPEENYLGVLGGVFVSFAMGLQNCITSMFSPFVLRTSHHSGTMLDIGIAIGQCIHQRNLDNFWKLKIFVPNYVGFWLGALFGCIACNHLKADALLINAGFAVFVGVGTLAVCTYWKYHELEVENIHYHELEKEHELAYQKDHHIEKGDEHELDSYQDLDEENLTQRKPFYGSI